MPLSEEKLVVYENLKKKYIINYVTEEHKKLQVRYHHFRI